MMWIYSSWKKFIFYCKKKRDTEACCIISKLSGQTHDILTNRKSFRVYGICWQYVIMQYVQHGPISYDPSWKNELNSTTPKVTPFKLELSYLQPCWECGLQQITVLIYCKNTGIQHDILYCVVNWCKDLWWFYAYIWQKIILIDIPGII